MPGFEIYELNAVLSEIKNPSHEDIGLSVGKTDYDKQVLNNIQGRTLLLAFVRMSSEKKMDLMTNMFQLVRNIRILADILNTFFSVNTKLISYSKISTDSNSSYEQFIHDDNRMMDPDALEDSILSSIEWFKTLDDPEQMGLITSLLRLSGGSIIKKMYVRLMKIFNRRNSEGPKSYRPYTSSSDLIFSDFTNEKLIKVADFKPRFAYQDVESDYNPDCPTSKKVMEGRKQWQAYMAKVRKEIEQELQRLNEPIIQRTKNVQTFKGVDSAKPKGTKISKTDEVTKKPAITKVQDNDMDWIQFLPLWSVKKIFSYLDEKTLQNLKNVNNYWATISKEVLAENKAREFMNATLQKSKAFLDSLIKIPSISIETDIREGEIVTEPMGYKKRMEKQRRTGTALRRKEKGVDTIQKTCALSECFKQFDTEYAYFLDKLQPFPTDMPKHRSQEADESPKASLSEVTTVRILKTKRPAEEKSPSGSELEEKISSTSSVMSLVPSIVVSMENMETW